MQAILCHNCDLWSKHKKFGWWLDVSIVCHTFPHFTALENALFHTIAPHLLVPALTVIWMTGSTTTTAAPGATPATDKGAEAAVYCTTTTAAEA